MTSADQFNSGLRGGLFHAKHRDRMGDAVWLFGWLVTRQTTQHLGVGLVLRGKPLTYRTMSEETGFPERTLRRYMACLRAEGYISVKYSSYKRLVVRILNAKKFDAKQLFFPQLFPQTIRPSVAGHPAKGGGFNHDVNRDYKNQNPRPQKPRPGTPLSVPRVKYGEIAQLIGGALSIVSRARGMEGQSSAGDVREQLKTWAAKTGVPYDSSRITTAIDIAEKRVAEGGRRR